MVVIFSTEMTKRRSMASGFCSASTTVASSSICVVEIVDLLVGQLGVGDAAFVARAKRGFRRHDHLAHFGSHIEDELQ